jgi:hypothetical protein
MLLICVVLVLFCYLYFVHDFYDFSISFSSSSFSLFYMQPCLFAICLHVCVWYSSLFICCFLYYKNSCLTFILSIWAGSCDYFAAMFMFGVRMCANFDVGFFAEQVLLYMCYSVAACLYIIVYASVNVVPVACKPVARQRRRIKQL